MKQELEAFKIIGIAVRTTNENNQAAKDIGTLWNTFMTEGILEKIPNKITSEIYSIYTDYESDYTKPYTTILGCRVNNIDEVPEGFVAITIEASSYKKFTAKGDLTKGAVYEKWNTIWNTDLDRSYTADFEIYGEAAQNPLNAEVDIFIAVNS
ncbi:GyrI-like domain-containing protein [Tenacibaculum soleae]|uniref:GyrI-like domain-containing protein n=1 Tax=Tenacibaculum soleae TaxID=447689 RepID=UPI0026E3664E|nr:GyrI-like domain-containing protein [Tenacibaculum soleae]MDO6743219.1 GyrI-like domain-containing protein [Tenacibaculum soleae]